MCNEYQISLGNSRHFTDSCRVLYLIERAVFFVIFVADLTLLSRIEEHACHLSYIVVNLKIIQIVVWSFVFKLYFLFLKECLILSSQN